MLRGAKAWSIEVLRDPRRRLAAWHDEEAGRFVVFAPVAMAAGILLWMRLEDPPGPLVTGLLAAMLPALWLTGVRRQAGAAEEIGRAGAVFALGMVLIAVRTGAACAPSVPQGLAAGEVTGLVERVEQRESDRRYTIRVRAIEGLEAENLPRRVRIVWRGKAGPASAGDLVRLRAQLAPPPGPAVPGGYDFSRQMFYQGIGGSGFAYTAPQVLARGGSGFKAAVEDLRERVADRAQEVLPGAAGAVAAALITGKRERIPAGVVDNLRDAGLAHLLAISGLHMGLVCGFIFWVLRFLLTRSTWLTLHAPVKKLAAFGALLGGAGYLLLSGGAWSAQRAYIMAAVVFGAILLDRRGISLRNAAIAALLILLIRPEAVLAPGFQMSFAAVLTLIAAFTEIEKRWPVDRDRTVFGRVLSFVAGLSLTSILAGLATGPFAAYHFGQIAVFGLLGNLLAVPVVTLAVMPALVLALFLMPLGLDGPVLWLIGWGLDGVIAVARWTASLPGAVHYVTGLSSAGILAVSLGLLVLTLPRAPWRLAGVLFLAIAPPLSASGAPPDVFVSRDLRTVGVRQEAGAPLALSSGRRDRFSVEVWLQSLGVKPDARAQALIPGCGAGACFARGGSVAIIPGRAALARACSSAQVVILRARAMPEDAERCRSVLLHLDPDGRHPPAALRRAAGGWQVERAGNFAERQVARRR